MLTKLKLMSSTALSAVLTTPTGEQVGLDPIIERPASVRVGPTAPGDFSAFSRTIELRDEWPAPPDPTVEEDRAAEGESRDVKDAMRDMWGTS